MTDDDRKLLTELLGEKFVANKHSLENRKDDGSWLCSCGRTFGAIHGLRCHQGLHNGKNRTFLTWQDVGDVKKKLVEKGMWDDFEAYALKVKNTPYVSMRSLCDWLFSPINEKGEAHFAQLVADWLKEEKI